MKTTRRTLGLVLVSGALVAGCSRNPDPTLSPAAQLATTNGRVVHALDLTRDAALIFTNDAGTGQLPMPIARRLVQTHESALKLIEVRSDGYVQVIQTSLAEVMKQLPPNLNRTLAPYFALASTLLGVLTNREIDEALSAETIKAYQQALASSLAFDRKWILDHP